MERDSKTISRVDGRLEGFVDGANNSEKSQDHEDPIRIAQVDTGQADAGQAGGGLGVEQAQPGDFDPNTVTQTFAVIDGQAVVLPTDTVISRILVSGTDLIIIAADGSVYLIENGAQTPPTLVIDGLTIPSTALAQAITSGAEIQPAAGPEGGPGAPGAPGSSGNNFGELEIGDIGDGVNTGGLLGFTEFSSETSEDDERDPPIEGDTAPVFLGAETVTVEEDDLNQGLGIKYLYLSKNYAQKFWESVGNNEDDSVDAFTATGNLNIDFQADGPAAVDPIVFTPGQAAPEGLTSDGLQLVYSISPDGLTLTALDGADGEESNIVFTVVLDPSVPGGQYTFTLFDNIDHLPTELGEELLNLGFSVTATDGDGSPTVGPFSVDIQDDVPILLTQELLEEERENEYEYENTDGQDLQIRSAVDLDSENGGYGREYDEIMLRMAEVDEDDLNNYDPHHNYDGDDVEGSQGTDGYPQGGGDNIKTSRDDGYSQSDGAVKAYGSLGVLFGADDGEARSIVFNLGSDDDTPPPTDTDSSDTDAIETISVAQRIGETTSGTPLTAYVNHDDGEETEIPLKSKGQDVEYVLSDDGTMLLAFAGGIPSDPFDDGGSENLKYIGEGYYGGPRLVFKVSLDDEDYGYFKFTLFDQLDHPKTDDPETEDTETSFEDTLVLKFGFTATDSDGDSIDSELTIKVKDDVPELKAPQHENDFEYWDVVGGNLIINGSFENFDGGLNQGGGVWGKFFDDAKVEGWELVDNGNPIEIQKSAYANDSDGVHELELDSDGNSTVYQEVPTHDCGYFKLSFDYSARPGSNAETNQVEVWWNGELLATITGDGSGLTEFNWQTQTFLVEGNGDTGLLEFRGAGTSDSLGGMIDSVSLYEVHNPYQVQGFVDEDDLSTFLSQGTDAERHFGLNFGAVATAGSLASLVKVGADEVNEYGYYTKGEFSFTENAVDTLEALNLTSKGEALSYYTYDSSYGSFIIAVDDNGREGPSLSDRPVFVLKLTGNGEFKFVLADQLDHADPGAGNTQEGAVEDIREIDFSQIVQISDYDGDTVVLNEDSFVIKVRDDVPETTGEYVSKFVSETDLDQFAAFGESPRVNSTGTSPDEDTRYDGSIGTRGSLRSLVKVGADEVNHWGSKRGDFNFKADAVVIETMQQAGLESKGDVLSFEVRGDTLIGYVNKSANFPGYSEYHDRTVFTLKVQENGDFKYVQYDQLDHFNGDDEPIYLLKLDFSKIVNFSDYDGDTIPLEDGSFIIEVGDDAPKTTRQKVSGSVDEDELDTRLSQGTDADGYYYSHSPISTTVSLRGLVEVGADEVHQHGKFGRENEGAFAFSENARSELIDKVLTSKGGALRYDVDGNKITAFVDRNDNDDNFEYGDRKVFTLELTGKGDFTYTQYDQLDHFGSHGPIDQLRLDFSKIIRFSDFDGDAITLRGGSLIIKVDDDRPELTRIDIHRSVDEDDIRTELSEGTYSFNDIGPLRAHGDLAKLVVIGADERPRFMFKDSAGHDMSDLGLTSQGSALSYAFEDGKLIAYVESGSGDSGYESGSDRTVFSLEIQRDGHFEYSQFDQLDHLDYPDDRFDNSDQLLPTRYLEIDFSGIIKISDFDGDTIGLRDGSFVIEVVDDQPYVSKNQDRIVVDEDGLDGNPGGPGDQGVTPPQNEDSGNLNILIGADEPGDINFADMHGKSVEDKYGDAVESDGVALEYTWNQDTHTLSAVKEGDVSGAPVFTMQITSVATAAYVFKLLGPVDHPEPDTEDNIYLKLDFNVSDYDQDTASGSVEVLIDDDTPVINSVENTTLSTPDSDPVMVMGDIDFSYGGDGPGSLKLKDVDVDGYDTVLSPDGQTLTGYVAGEPETKVFEVSLAPDGAKYTFELFGDLPSGTTTETKEVIIPNGHDAATGTFGELTFDGKLFRHGSYIDSSSNRDYIDSHNGNGFGIGRDDYVQDLIHNGKRYLEGFHVDVAGDPITSFSFDMDFYRETDGAHVYWSALKNGSEVGSGNNWVDSPGYNAEARYTISPPGVDFDEVRIHFNLPNSGDRSMRLNDFEYTREIPDNSTEFDFQVVAEDNDGDKTHGSFTVNVQGEEPTTSITLRILQQNHGSNSRDKQEFEDLVIKIDGIEVSYSLIDSDNATLIDNDLKFSGGSRNEDRYADIRIDGVPLDGTLQLITNHSNTAEWYENNGEGVKFFLDAGAGFKLIGNYNTHWKYTGGDTDVERSFKLDYAADGSISNISDPIVLDLNGDGVGLLSSADGVSFDIDADGTSEQTGWVGADDGLLAVDLDGSGAIEDGSEVFSENFNGGDFANSLEALASLDDNGDGVIDANDAAFDDILVWQDANSDGVSQTDELQSLADRGITSIDLGATAVDTDANGNRIFAEGQFTLENGETGTYAGVDFAGASLPSEGDLRQQRQIAAGDAIAAAIGAVAIIDLMTDAADAATASVSAEPEHGEVTVNADLSVTYEGADGFTGTDSFTIEVVDSSGTVEIRTVHLDVNDGVVTASAVSAPGDTVLLGTDGGDTLEVGSGAETSPDGEAAADAVLIGGAGDDVLIGGAGDDVLIGGAGNDELHGNDGADTLFGGAGDDALFGGDGEDTLVGGTGSNELSGGGDADVFVITKGALEDGLLDEILDYNLAEGDAVDLSQLFDVDGGDIADFVQYDDTTGKLSVDADGGAGATAEVVATFTNTPVDIEVLFTDNGSDDTTIV